MVGCSTSERRLGVGKRWKRAIKSTGGKCCISESISCIKQGPVFVSSISAWSLELFACIMDEKEAFQDTDWNRATHSHTSGDLQYISPHLCGLRTEFESDIPPNALLT